jgi:uncharacterized protein (TIGR02453 family)
MQYFTDDFFDFFNELSDNNSKEWFDSNRERYVASIREPFKKLVKELSEELLPEHPTLNTNPSNAIFRINRDIRFSKDKTPYKDFISAVISPEGKKGNESTGFYFELRTTGVNIYSGMYMPSTQDLYAIREAIVQDIPKFKSIIHNTVFHKTFGDVFGNTQKRIPKEFKEAGEQFPMLYNKQFMVTTSLSPSTITSTDLLDVLIEHFTILYPFNQFFRDALGQ